ncbi:hypothetical protein B0H14DRAFT_3517183 [Mycena olivaceomarginata]|nr:hypothetical protein B0H14DRAFT_3517183 [Mycena olivaceomarginata]
MDPSNPSSFAFDDPHAADLANMDPGYWAGTHLDGDVPLDHEDEDSDDDDEQDDQLDWSEPHPPPAASTDRPHIDPLSFSTGETA